MEKVTGDISNKVFVNSQNQVTILCPKCGVSKTFDVTKLNVSALRFKVTCNCGETFRGEIEFRKHYRKSVKLPGKYIHIRDPKRGVTEVMDLFISPKEGEMLVVDLSLIGLGFTSSTPMGSRWAITLKFSSGLITANARKSG